MFNGSVLMGDARSKQIPVTKPNSDFIVCQLEYKVTEDWRLENSTKLMLSKCLMEIKDLHAGELCFEYKAFHTKNISFIRWMLIIFSLEIATMKTLM